jgi:hypothetical protein
MRYKRNQIEEAISRLLEPRSAEPSSELRTRLKRLLETDREYGCAPRSTEPERAHYAFYTSDPPGSGVEIWFSEYEAFALFNGLRIMGHGWPQGFAVSVMRRTRRELERQHARILRQDPEQLFSQERILQEAREGDMAFDNADPVLLTIVSQSRTTPNDEGEPVACAICRGASEAMKFAWKVASGVGALTIFELATAAHKLSGELKRTEPRRRGRSG